ncbi:MAG TPA: hypothetical protein VN642_17090 [Dongiaceae bacterium]|nr:hypothetical protein [Dongiaceae bacterium]
MRAKGYVDNLRRLASVLATLIIGLLFAAVTSANAAAPVNNNQGKPKVEVIAGAAAAAAAEAAEVAEDEAAAEAEDEAVEAAVEAGAAVMVVPGL